MPELPANASPAPRNYMPANLPRDLGAFATRMRSSDMALAFVVLGIIVILIVPLPPIVLDLLFAI